MRRSSASRRALVFTPTLENYQALWTSGFRQSFVNSLVVASRRRSRRCCSACRRPMRCRAGQARRIAGTFSLWILASAHGAADRLHDPVLPRLPAPRAARYAHRPGHHLHDLQPVARDLDDAALLRPAAARAGGSGLDRRRDDVRRPSPASILPLSAPGLAATAILCFLFAWNDFFFALILTRTEAMTAPVAVVNFMNYEGWEWGRIAAGGTMVMLPVLVFSLAVRKYLVHGLTGGAVKG
jgi:multiple sugar transport system permease protein